jgi:hypothetical protein
MSVPEHNLILELARVALWARDDAAAWKRDAEAAYETHTEACNALWEELERQVTKNFRSDP